MHLCFNELSIFPFSSNIYLANDKMKLFSEAVSAARKYGFNIIRSEYDTHQIQLTENYTLSQWLFSNDVPRDQRDFLFGMFTLPFISEDDEGIEDQYIEANYFFEDAANGIAKTKCLGLAAAFLYDTISISLQSNNAWRKNILDISIELDGNIQFEIVKNVYSKGCYDFPFIHDFVEKLEDVVLQESPLAPADKDLHLASHHGQNELKALWDRLKNNPYVVAARSTDWGGKRFIRKFNRNGVVEIVLVDSEREYALWVQTTGRNLRETKAIAEILQDRFE